MPGPAREPPVTTLLADWREGNAGAGRELIGRLQPELRRLAAQYMKRERSGHTLQPTALVNELFLRVMAGQPVAWQDRAHFLAVAAQQLRRILVDHSRKRLAAKRGRGLQVTLTEGAASDRPVQEEMLDLHVALEELGALDGRAAQVAELRYLGGLSEKETAEALGMSVATVKRDWIVGRAWLRSRLKGHD